jgi:hypothetical protein
MRALRVALILTVTLAGCGGVGRVDGNEVAGNSDLGRSSGSTSTAGATTVTSRSSAASSSVGLGSQLDGGLSCEPAFLEAGTGRAGDAEIPIYHRAAPSCCPTERGPAPGTQPYDGGIGGTANGCSTDSQCTAGADGRCFPWEGLVGPGGCSYDQCFTDSDCSGAPCECRTSASDNTANVCAPGGNCALDSDCGSGGYCSPSQACFFYAPPTYYCHTASDTCINDDDCPLVDAGGGCGVPRNCVYDPQAQHWACSQQACCPP